MYVCHAVTDWAVDVFSASSGLRCVSGHTAQYRGSSGSTLDQQPVELIGVKVCLQPACRLPAWLAGRPTVRLY